MNKNPAEKASFDALAFQRVLENDSFQYREAFKTFLDDPIFKPRYDLSTEEKRELVLAQIKYILDNEWISISDLQDNALKWCAFHEITPLVGDISMSIKFGVHFLLYSASVLAAGTPEQFASRKRQVDTGAEVGSFSMTEIGHGSDVRGIETTAHYDPQTEEFVIHSPTVSSQKSWIGGVGWHAQYTICFANLYINGKNEGVHLFNVRIRDPKLNPLPGISIRDNGNKLGLHGIDNGRLMFNQYRAPRSSLLSKLAQVSRSGRYTSVIKNPDTRFGVMVSPLVGGRVSISASSMTVGKLALLITVRYAHSRKQFSDPLDPKLEVPIINYLTTQKILYPLLARVVCIQFAVNHLKLLFADYTKDFHPRKVKQIHYAASAIKPVATWTVNELLHQCREITGAQGFISRNRISELLCSHHIYVTFEGANTVLLQQVAKIVLSRQMGPNKLTRKDLQAPTPSSPNDLVWLLSLFKYRVSVLTARLGKLVQTHLKKHKSSNVKTSALLKDAFNANLNLVCKLGLADAEYQILNFTLQTLESLSRKSSEYRSTIPIFTVLAQLYACDTITQDLGWFLSNKAFPASNANSIEKHVRSCCDKIHPNSLAIVNSFGIHDALVHAPIAFDYVKAYDFDTGSFGTEITPYQHLI